MAQIINMEDLLEAGAHFGHRTSKWNPKMKKYIYGARNGIHIIDLQKTVVLLKEAYKFVVDIAADGGKVLFVGTKRQAQEAIKEEANRVGMYYVTNRWLGGLLTNFQTVKKSIDRMKKLEGMRDDGSFEGFKKKEALGYEREIKKLNFVFDGIRELGGVPDIIFIVDPKKENIAFAEAKKLNIPVISIADTNSDPDGIDFVIPANDDAIRAIKLFSSKIADAIIEGAQKREEILKEQAEQKQAEQKQAAQKQAVEAEPVEQ